MSYLNGTLLGKAKTKVWAPNHVLTSQCATVVDRLFSSNTTESGNFVLKVQMDWKKTVTNLITILHNLIMTYNVFRLAAVILQTGNIEAA